MKILIVDDEAVYRDLLEDILQPYGALTVAEDGLEAVSFFEKSLAAGTPFGLVVMDIQMPNMDGMEALKQMRTLERKFNVSVQNETIIIMATSMADTRIFMEAYQYGGCSDYIVKPVGQEILIEKLKKSNLI